jgi:folylpolyglutamate synthase
VPQPTAAMNVIVDRVAEKSPLKFIAITSEDINSMNLKLGLAGKHQKINAKLAINICKEWASMINKDSKRVDFKASDIEVGLSKAVWPGRCQTIVDDRFPTTSWYLDGAHTPESLEVTFWVDLGLRRMVR